MVSSSVRACDDIEFICACYEALGYRPRSAVTGQLYESCADLEEAEPETMDFSWVTSDAGIFVLCWLQQIKDSNRPLSPCYINVERGTTSLRPGRDHAKLLSLHSGKPRSIRFWIKQQELVLRCRSWSGGESERGVTSAAQVLQWMVILTDTLATWEVARAFNQVHHTRELSQLPGSDW
jgi:hypothetical protein